MKNEKWVCKKCLHESFEKPKKNQVCECKGRYIHYKQCKCGKWFEDKRYSKKYCSSECSGRTVSSIRVGKIELICENCGREFMRYASNVRGDLHFCGIDCKKVYYKGDKKKSICECCGKEFEVYASVLKSSNASGRYCSQECYWKSMEKEGKPYKGFEKAKKLHFSKQQFCAVCGTTEKIEIHHIIPNRLTQNQSKENLIPLCVKHHRMVESLTRSLHEDFSGRYGIELFLLNAILRPRQATTSLVVKKHLEERKNYAVKD